LCAFVDIVFVAVFLLVPLMMFCPTWVCGIWLQRPISAPCSPLCLNAPMILYFIHVLYGLYSQSMPMPMPMPHRPRAFIIFAFNSLMTFVSVSLAISHPAQSHICQQSLRSTRSQIYLPIYIYIYIEILDISPPSRIEQSISIHIYPCSCPVCNCLGTTKDRRSTIPNC